MTPVHRLKMRAEGSLKCKAEISSWKDLLESNTFNILAEALLLTLSHMTGRYSHLNLYIYWRFPMIFSDSRISITWCSTIFSCSRNTNQIKKFWSILMEKIMSIYTINKIVTFLMRNVHQQTRSREIQIWGIRWKGRSYLFINSWQTLPKSLLSS